MKKTNINMCEGPLLINMIRYAIPVMLTGLLQQLFNTLDIILAGQLGTSGNDAVAAVGSTTAITSLMINFFIGCSTGSAVTVSYTVGSKDKESIKNAIHTAILLAITLGSVLTVVGVIISKQILTIMSTPDSIIGLSTTYLRTYFLGMIPYMVYNFGAAILRAVGEAKKPMYFLLISGPIKLILTFLFVSVLNFDVAGLALATTCSQAISAMLVIITLIKRNDACRLILKELKFHKKPLINILRLGIPSGIQSATFSLSSVIIQSSINSLSYLNGFITGNAAATSIENFANIITGTFYQVSINFTGQNVGANKYDRVKKVYIYNSAMSAVFIAAVSLVVCTFSRQLLGFYIENDPVATTWGTVRIMFIFIPLIIMGQMDVTTGSIRGLGVSFSSMLISLISVCGFRILWTLTVFRIPEFHTPQCLYLSYPISWIITFLAEFILYIITYNKNKRGIRL